MTFQKGGPAAGGALRPPVTITGTNPATVPLSIVGAASQSADYFDITANGGSAGGVFNVASTGGMTSASSSSSSSTLEGLSVTATETGTGAVIAILASAVASHSGVNTAVLEGGNFSYSFLDATGTLTAGYAMVIAPPTITSGGTVTTGNGILIQAQKATGVTTAYAINQQGTSDNVVFAGPTQVGSTSGKVGFYGTSPATKPTVTGSKGANAALTSLMTALSGLGLVVDSTT